MLIGLSGKAKSGKDTAYQFIQEWAESEGRPVRRDAFADRLKLSAARALGFTGSLAQAVEFCNDLKEDYVVGFAKLEQEELAHPMAFITGREYLQFYGTEAHREVFGADFWVSAVLDQYLPEAGEIVVVTDVRFDNEAEAVRPHGFVWQILRPGNEGAKDSHASEQPVSSDLIDEILVNDGSLDHFRGLVLSRLERLVYA